MISVFIMRGASSDRTYTVFLFSTLAATALFYFGAKALFGIAGALFFVYLFGQGHYLMAYLWSVPRYRRMPPETRRRTLAVLVAAAALFLGAIYAAYAVPFHYAVLFVIVIGAFHNFRDYEFFFRQLSSGFRDVSRPFATILLLAASFLTLYFGLLSSDFQNSVLVFGGLIPRGVFTAGFYSSLALWGAALFFALRGRGAPETAPAPFRAPLHAAALFGAPAALGAAAAAINPIDLAFLVTAWHYALWLGFMTVKVGHDARLRAAAPAPRGVLPRLLELWRGSVPRFLFMTALLYAALFAIFVFLYADTMPAFDAAITTSFFWGTQGFIFFSFAHIVFTELPFPFAEKIFRR